MKSSKRQWHRGRALGLIPLMLLTISCQSAPGPLASPDEPHGVLVAAAPPAGLQPIAIAYIDDRKVGGKSAYWVKPGMRRIQSRLLSGDFAKTLKSSGETGQKQGELMLEVEAGYRYLLVGEVTARREWRVFVLKKEPLKAAPATKE
jgi:hypothetical protein